MLKPRWNPGNRHKFSKETRARLVALATSRPRDLGLPFGQWSLRRLRDTAVARGIVESISLEWLRVICDEADITHQSIRTWKRSDDPKFEEKRRRIDRLTVKRHNPPIVLSMDEIGPISLKPHGGKGWFRKGLPGRIPATYDETGGGPIRVRLSERLPPDVERQAAGAQGRSNLASIHEVPALEVSSRSKGLHHPGRTQRPLDSGDLRVGEGPQSHPRPLGNRRQLDEPRRMPRGAAPSHGDGGQQLVELGRGGRGVPKGGATDQPRAQGLREGVPEHSASSRANIDGRYGRATRAKGTWIGSWDLHDGHGQASRLDERAVLQA